MGLGSMRRGARDLRGRDRPVAPPCLQPQCFDLLVRKCVACSLLRTTEPRPASPGNREGWGPSLGLALALVLLGLVSWRRRRRRPGAAAAPDALEALDGDQDEPLDSDNVLSLGTLDATAPIWLPPSEDPATTPPAHSVPVPATELGSTELVTTKTAGPEQP
ncbi:tumor necrosis factor receptor superfamily member 13C [Neophocaena asiaeorientalis asiaeorientalis]|uniref:Tumor necrosis factor receptor superfamily member 13C n=1 Tax=Neophocaena asiaeorientalis asiaeorientalis TaxID=1706337 RepID=A0A341AU85_NEOAA|nr:tumor necrosis factor receptor superfamily member 13C [Neophocaena asiaeorientalis asiaeorientalis]